MRLALAALLLVGCKQASPPAVDGPSAARADAARPPSPDATPPDATPPKPSRWVYKAVLTHNEDMKRSKHEVVFLETGRKKVGDRQAILLAVEVDGKPMSEEMLEDWSGAPFPTLASTLSLLVGTHKKERVVWLVFGPPEKAEESVEPLPPTWPLGEAARRQKPPKEPTGEPYVYGKKIGAWSSICAGDEHSGEESGDSFSWERCFEPTVGITRLEFESVWGGYELSLTSAPAGFALPE